MIRDNFCFGDTTSRAEYKLLQIHDELFQNLYSTHICHVIYKKRIFSTCNVSHFERVGKKKVHFSIFDEERPEEGAGETGFADLQSKKENGKV